MGKKSKEAKKKTTHKKPTSKTDQWDTFCLEYVKDFDRVRAYKAAGYKVKSGQVATNNASRLMRTNAYIAEKIHKLLEGQEKRSTKEADDVVAELIKIGFSNIQDFIGEGNQIKDISSIDRGLAAAVKSVRVDIRHDGGKSEGYTEKMKISTHDKRGALVDLGKYFGIFERDNRQQNIDWEKIARLMEKQKAND